MDLVLALERRKGCTTCTKQVPIQSLILQLLFGHIYKCTEEVVVLWHGQNSLSPFWKMKDLDRSLRQSWSLMPVYLRAKTTAAAAVGSESCHLLPLSTHLLVLNRFQNRREFRQTWQHLSSVTAPLQAVTREERQLATLLTGWWSFSAWQTVPQKQLSREQQIYTKGKKIRIKRLFPC